MGSFDLSNAPIQRFAGVLVVTPPPDLTGEEWLFLRRAMLERYRSEGSKQVVVDLGRVDLIDTEACEQLRRMARSVRVLGGQCALAAVQAAVASALVDLEVDLDGVDAFLSTEEAIDALGGRRA